MNRFRHQKTNPAEHKIETIQSVIESIQVNLERMNRFRYIYESIQ